MKSVFVFTQDNEYFGKISWGKFQGLKTLKQQTPIKYHVNIPNCMKCQKLNWTHP